MCLPVLGAVASIGAGVAGAIGQNQSASAQANAQNAAAISNYNHQIQLRKLKWRQTLQVWDQKNKEYDMQIDRNLRAVNMAYSGEQSKQNEILDKAAFANQDALVERLKASGTLNARGLARGISTERVKQINLAAWGRQNAAQAASLASSRRQALVNMGQVQTQAYYDNYNAWTKVAIAPEPDLPPPPPTMMPGPSGMGVAAAALGGLAQGFQTFQSLQPPGGGGGSIPGYGGTTPSTGIFSGNAGLGSGYFSGSNNYFSNFGSGGTGFSFGTGLNLGQYSGSFGN